MNQFQQDLTTFVEFVEQYKQYQEIQQQTLQQLQDESVSTITNLSLNQNTRYTDSIEAFDQQSGQLNTGLEDFGKQLEKNNNNISTLSTVRLEQADQQTEEMMAYFKEREESSINKVESELQSLKQKVTRENQGNSNRSTVNASDVSTEQTTTEKLNMEEEKKELQAIAKRDEWNQGEPSNDR